jgi:hypothetical protein
MGAKKGATFFNFFAFFQLHFNIKHPPPGSTFSFPLFQSAPTLIVYTPLIFAQQTNFESVLKSYRKQCDNVVE